MKRLAIVLLLAEFVFSQASAVEPIRLRQNLDVRLPITDFDYVFTIPESALKPFPGIITSVGIEIDLIHDATQEISLRLRPSNSQEIRLYTPGDSLAPGNGLVRYDLAVSDRLKRELYSLAGRTTLGDWSLVAKNHSPTSTPTIRFWRLIIHWIPSYQIGRFSGVSGSQTLELGVDGYGSFGDLSKLTPQNLGGLYNASGFTFGGPFQTVYQSLLSMNNTPLSSLQLFEGEWREVIDISKESRNRYDSQFQVDGVDVNLHQALIEESNSLLLRQIYEFEVDELLDHPLTVSRFFNAKMPDPSVDPLGLNNFIFTEQGSSSSTEVFTLNQIKKINTPTNYVSVSMFSLTGEPLPVRTGSWFELENAFQINADSLFMPQGWVSNWNDFNEDGLTDTDHPIDAAIGQAIRLPLDKVDSASIVVETRWGIITPSTLLAPASTPTQRPKSSAPVWVSKLPDIHLIYGHESGVILDLDDYLEDTDSEAMQFSIDSDRNLPFTVDSENRLHCNLTAYLPPPGLDSLGAQGFIEVFASDEDNRVSSFARVHVSTRSFNRSITDPILLTGESAEYSLQVFENLTDWQAIAPESVVWSLSESEGGLDAAVDATGHLRLSGGTSSEIQLISVRADFDGNITATPVAPTATPSPLVEPTATIEPTATFVPTESPTPTGVPSITPAPTSTPPPSPMSPTPRPTSPPAPPTVTPTPACSEAFEFVDYPPVSSYLGPIALDRVLRAPGQGDSLIVAHLFDGALAVYDWSEASFEDSSIVEFGFGVRDMTVGHFSANGGLQAAVLNVETRRIEFAELTDSGWQSMSSTIDLTDKTLPLENSDSIEAAIQALGSGDSDGDGIDELHVRLADGFQAYKRIDGLWQLVSEVHINGETRCMEVKDIDSDGDVDWILAARESSRERLLIYQNQDGAPSLRQTIATDIRFSGDFSKQLILEDVTGDGFVDLSALVFSDTVQIYRGTSEGSFVNETIAEPFPPGIVDAVAFADYDRDGVIDLAGLHRGQNGLSVIWSCRESGRYIRSTEVRLTNEAPSNEGFSLIALDADGDGDLDLAVSRSLADQLILIENQSNE